MSDLPKLQFPDESAIFLSPSWELLTQLTYELSQQVIQSGTIFDRIVTLAKGGWPMTRSLIDFTQINKIASIGIKFYAGINKRYDEPQIYQDIPVSVKGERVLLFDDIADSGKSLEFTQQLLLELGSVEVKTATIFYKAHSVIKPDFFAKEVSGWVVFPFEQIETVKLLGKKWRDQGLSNQELIERFKKFGFLENAINQALQNL